MDLFFEVYRELKYDFVLTRWVKLSLKSGIEFRIYSDGKLIVFEKSEDIEEREYVYLLAARSLIRWAIRNYDHASSSTREENKWVTKLSEQLSVDIADSQN